MKTKKEILEDIRQLEYYLEGIKKARNTQGDLNTIELALDELRIITRLDTLKNVIGGLR